MMMRGSNRAESRQDRIARAIVPAEQKRAAIECELERIGFLPTPNVE